MSALRLARPVRRRLRLTGLVAVGSALEDDSQLPRLAALLTD